MKPFAERNAFLALAVLLFFFIAARATLVPFTHDEACTFFLFTLPERFLPYIAHWDAGNHLLATALASISYNAFGMAPLALRMASVLAFVVYACYTWRAGTWVRDPLVRTCLRIALLTTPFLLDFFALYRGYGLAMAFWMMAIFHLVRYAQSRERAHLLGALCGSMLAAYASLSMMVLWCAVLALLILFNALVAQRAKERLLFVLFWSTLGLLPLLFEAQFGAELARQGFLYYGSNEGLFNGTLASLCTSVLGNGSWMVRVPIAALVILSLVFVAVLVIRHRFASEHRPLIVVALLLFSEMLGRWVLGEFFHTPYPTDRTALQFVPLSIVLFALVVDRLSNTRNAMRWAALLLMAFPIRTLITANLDHTSYWPQEAISGNILRAAEERQQRSDRSLLVSGYNQSIACWEFARMWSHPGMPLLGDIGFPQAYSDLLLIDTTAFRTPNGFRTVALSPNGQAVLKERIAPLELTLLHDTVYTRTTTTDEYINLWERPATDRTAAVLCVDIDALLTTEQTAPAVVLAVECDDKNGAHPHYESLELSRVRGTWRRDTLRVARRIPPITPGITRTVVYLWNIDKQPVTVERCRVRVYSIVP